MRKLTLCVVSILSLVVLSAANSAQAQSRQNNPNTQPQKTSSKPVDLISMYMAKEKPLYQGPISGLAKKTIVDQDKRVVTIGQVSKGLFSSQDRLQAELRKAPAGALLGPVKVVETAVELKDAYIITRKVGFIVANPSALRGASASFAKQVPKARGQMTIKDLTPEMTTKFFAAKSSLLAQGATGPQTSASSQSVSYPANHPLRKAAQVSDQALLDAIVDGAGEMTVEDSFLFLKVLPVITPSGQIMIPGYSQGVYNLGTREPMKQSFARPMPTQLPAPATSVTGGVTTMTSQLINGFTYPHHWHWKRRWEFFMGHAQLEAALNYGFGVRVPIELETKLEPNTITNRGATDTIKDVTATLKAKTVDGDADFYRRAGMFSNGVLNGKEFVLYANFCYGYSFEAFWVDLGYRPCRPDGFDMSQDYKPPMGSSWQRLFEYFIPAEITRTVVDLGVVKGSLQLGAALEGKGSFSAKVRMFLGSALLASIQQPNQQRSTEHNIILADPNAALSFRAVIPAMNQSGQTTFGIESSAYTYRAELSLLPGFKYGVTIGYKALSRTFSDTYWFESWRIHLPSITLGTHPTTRTEVRVVGNKTYQR